MSDNPTVPVARAGFLDGTCWRSSARPSPFSSSFRRSSDLRRKGSTRALSAAGEIWIALVLLAAFQFAVASVMTGAESRRSFFLFNAIFDLTAGALCLRVTQLLLGVRTAAAGRAA